MGLDDSHEVSDHGPTWLEAAIDQRVALLEDHHVGQAKVELVVTPLAEPADGDMERWEHSCDNCGVRPPEGIHTGHTFRTLRSGQQVLITFGCCTKCKNA